MFITPEQKKIIQAELNSLTTPENEGAFLLASALNYITDFIKRTELTEKEINLITSALSFITKAACVGMGVLESDCIHASDLLDSLSNRLIDQFMEEEE